jgi:hypothetical protein
MFSMSDLRRALTRRTGPGPGWRVLCLLFVVLGLGATAAGALETLVLEDGSRLLVRDFGHVRNGFHLYRLRGGATVGLWGAEIDIPATREANGWDPPEPELHKPSAGTELAAHARRQVAAFVPPKKPLSLSFRQAPVADVLILLADIAEINLVLHPQVAGTITVELKDVPWSAALQTVLRTAELGRELRGNVLYVAPVRILLQQLKEEEALRQVRNRR